MSTKFSMIESIISNSCFLILLLTTIYYWIKIIFFSSSSELIVLQNNTISTQNPNTSFKFGFLSLFLTNLLLTIQLIGRWIESGHFPLSGLYESLVFLTWGIIFFYLIIEYWIKSEFLGVFITPIILLILGFTSFTLPTELQQNKPLVPALQSNWLLMHVSVMMMSYASLLLGCLIAIGYVIIFFFLDKKYQEAVDQNVDSIFISSTLIRIENISLNNETTIPLMDLGNLPETKDSVFMNSGTDYKNLLNLFDNLSYRTIGIGFSFLTLGILSGAVWANETWGSYWSWDPKETWALITWLTFAIYLHTRFLKGWKGIKPASIATVGFFIIWICYLGVNFLGKGLHSYGFLTS